MLQYAHQKDGGHFPFEWPTLLEALNCTVTVVDPAKNCPETRLSFRDFYEQATMDYKYILCFDVPKPSEGMVFKAYSSRQRSRFAESYASAVFSCIVERSGPNKGKIQSGSVKLVFNNLGSVPLRMTDTENQMSGMELAAVSSAELPKQVGEALRKEVTAAISTTAGKWGPGYGDPSMEKKADGSKKDSPFEGFKQSLCHNYLQKYWLALLAEIPDLQVDPRVKTAENPYLKEETTSFTLCIPKETLPNTNTDKGGLTQPVNKIDALDQSNATATYTGDIPLPTGTLFGCPIYAEKLGDFQDLGTVDGEVLKQVSMVEGFIDLIHGGIEVTSEGDKISCDPLKHNDISYITASRWPFKSVGVSEDPSSPSFKKAFCPIFAKPRSSIDFLASALGLPSGWDPKMGLMGARYLGHHMGFALAKTPEAARKCAHVAQKAIKWLEPEKTAIVDMVDVLDDTELSKTRIVSVDDLYLAKDAKNDPPPGKKDWDGSERFQLFRKWDHPKWDDKTGYWTDLTADDSNTAFETSEKKANGRKIVGNQYHYALEPITVLADPQASWTRPLMVVHASTRAPHKLAECLFQLFTGKTTNWTRDDVDVRVRRCGGAYGCKTNNTIPIAIQATLGAYKHKRPVRIMADLDEQLRHNCSRPGYVFDYQVGFQTNGKINIVRGDIYLGCGFLAMHEPCDFPGWILHDSLDGCYFIENWDVQCKFVVTDTPMSQAMRAPGTMCASSFMENTVIDAVARELGMDPFTVRQRNWYDKAKQMGPPPALPGAPPSKTPLSRLISPGGMDITDIPYKTGITDMVDQLNYQERQTQVKEFNGKSKWVKKGLSLTVHRYPVFCNWRGYDVFDTLLRINRDGQVLLRTGAVEMGNGTYTKIAQTVVRDLFGEVAKYMKNIFQDGAKSSKFYSMGVADIHFGELQTNVSGASPNGDSGSSVCGEFACYSASIACQVMVKRLTNFVFEMSADLLQKCTDWPSLIVEAAAGQIQLDVHLYTPDLKDIDGRPEYYNNMSVTLTEVELDCLTGQVEIVHSELRMDMGKSMNPLVDMGQLQGAFLIGSGHALCEVQNRSGVSVEREGEWEPDTQVDWFDYHPPTPWEGPKKWHMVIEPGDENKTKGTMGDKSVGETGAMLGFSSVYSAVQAATYAMQEENGIDKKKVKPSPTIPMTVNIRQGLCRPEEDMPAIIHTCATSDKFQKRTKEDKRRKFVPPTVRSRTPYPRDFTAVSQIAPTVPPATSKSKGTPNRPKTGQKGPWTDLGRGTRK
jgi:xanthine dehydrogenase large subunit